MHKSVNDLLKKLGLQDINPGCMSAYAWHSEINTETGQLESYQPASGTPLARVACCTEKDYDLLLMRAEQAFLSWRSYPAPKRGEIIRQIADVLRKHKDLLGSLVALEMGKSKQEGDGEVQEMIDIADFAVGQSRMLYGYTMHSERPSHRMYEQWQPLGIVAVITAFNFPVAVWAWNAFISAICGNVTVWKPSSKTPLCAIAVMHLCNIVLKQNDCPEIFSLMIPSTHELTHKMLEDNRIPLVSFTGSTKIGKQVAEKVASRLGRSLLELGGNNAIIIDETADLNVAIPAVVFAAIGTAGQRCTTARRLFVHDSCFESVLEQLKHAYAQVTVGDPLDISHLMGPLIDAQAVSDFKSAVNEAISKGGQVAFGGRALSGSGYFVEPTLIYNVHNDWEIVQRETFAPILYVMPYHDLTEAIDLQNSVRQGLSSALFTQSIRHAEYFLSVLGSDCGIANINIGTSGAEIGGAFGGEKETGGGRESGSDAWKAYMRRQTNTINWGDGLALAQGIKFNLS